MFFGDIKRIYSRVLLGVVVVAFALISTLGIFSSTEMQEAQHRQDFSLGSSFASTPDSAQQEDHLEDLVAWDNFGPSFSFASLVALVFLLFVATLSWYKQLSSVPAQSFFGLYTKPPGLSFALQEAFSSGLINGKAY